VQRRAYRGHWGTFPVSPADACERFAAVIGSGRGSFRVAIDLEEAARVEDARLAGDPARRLALWRGLLTAGFEAFWNGLRDSDGAVATVLGDALDAYARLPWRETGIDPAGYWTDLCELCIWEDWGIRHRRESAPFRHVPRTHAPLIEELLRALEAEHRAARLDYQADEAIQMVAWLAVATHSYTRFVPVAERLGADWWIPVVALAETAMKSGRTQLARDVFGAAIAPGGLHTEHLARRCRELTGAEPPRRRRLRAVQ